MNTYVSVYSRRITPSSILLARFSLFSISARQLKLIFHKASPMDFYFESIARSVLQHKCHRPPRVIVVDGEPWGAKRGQMGGARASPRRKLGKQIKLWPQLVSKVKTKAKPNAKAKAKAMSQTKANKLEKVSAERCQSRRQRCFKNLQLTIKKK